MVTDSKIENAINKVLSSDLSKIDNFNILVELLLYEKDIDPEYTLKIMRHTVGLCGKFAAQDGLFLALYWKMRKVMAILGDFDSYMLYVEKKRDSQDKYYVPRRKQLIKHGVIKGFQDLLDDNIDILAISMPQGTGKSTIGEFFLAYIAGMYPEKCNMVVSYSGELVRMFYDAILNIVTNDEYAWKELFSDVSIESQNANSTVINFGKPKTFETLNMRAIGASVTGRTRAEGFSYCDDLVSGYEEAISKERLDKLWELYGTQVKGRKKDKCKEIHIATRWSVHDPIGHIERMYEGNDRARFINIPATDHKTGESNFNYDYGVGFSKEYFSEIRDTMDETMYRILYNGEPIEREGLLYDETTLNRYFKLPEEEPDAVMAVCDTKDAGKDNASMPIMYKYGDMYYMEDVLFDDSADINMLDERMAEKLALNKVQAARFESNNGGGRCADKVQEKVEARGAPTRITKKFTTSNKETKIIVNSDWVKKHVYFKDKTLYSRHEDYGRFMENLCGYTVKGKNAHDDAPDSLAMFAMFVQDLIGAKVETRKRNF